MDKKKARLIILLVSAIYFVSYCNFKSTDKDVFSKNVRNSKSVTIMSSEEIEKMVYHHKQNDNNPPSNFNEYKIIKTTIEQLWQ